MSAIALRCACTARRAALSRNFARTLATEAASTSTSAAPPPVQQQKTRSENRRVFSVRSWDEIRSMPEFLAMLRGVEKRFGRVREFRLRRDHDISTSYPNSFQVVFEDDEASRNISEKGTNIRVEVPVVNSSSLGGIGLAELTGLLHPQEREESLSGSGLYGEVVKFAPNLADEEKSVRVVELILRSTNNIMQEITPSGRFFVNKPFGVAFHEWGGFYQRQRSEDPPQSPHMRQMLARWAGEADLRRPKQSPVNTVANARFALPVGEPLSAVGEAVEDLRSTEVASTPSAEPMEGVAQVSLSSRSTETPVSEPLLFLASTPSIPSSATPRLSRKQKILALARENARTPMPDSAAERVKAEAKRKADQEEKERRYAESGTMRERLLRLMGGRWS